MDSRICTSFARLMASALCVSTLLVTAMPFDLRRGSSDTDLDLQGHVDLGLDDLDKLRLIFPPGLIEEAFSQAQGKVDMPLPRQRTSSRSSERWAPKSKRFDFGFAGLDTYDAIHRALEQPARGTSNSGSGYNMLMKMQRHG
ncbi:neuropeptides CP2 isoform X2 [Aplysia californica]|uniref:Neuropeptides CP2 n=1 Tax=Aplysia californica TaxID=6500 RepID=CP2_APLCA|nr:neuropeptides CP2 precursor [Aplysia californica]XP_035827035.1 neuropeptides CP2 isoform X2 [Aplysia californica]Q8T0Y7.1 RecName: Full=Neuropeptides CP2; Contains: RecName: Full=CP2-derived peptide 1; Contains: RecName: Full=CP2-derived peptide 2; Contains: RecName: Full=CP2-derived peptide 3; Contains: RecName: Full=CP2-derived peptide 4; Contains: RecName: Full=CP2-derived peptide 5; Contains: RecName: Full=CP2-derived peptide 6; Contains: RecName: Full=CP2-derived peptide 7; Contains: Rec